MDAKKVTETVGKFRSDLMYKYIKIDQIRDWVMRLSDRDRKIVIASAVGICIFLLLFLYYMIDLSLDSKEKRLKSEIVNFDKIIDLKQEYQASFGLLKKIEKTIEKTPKSFSLATHLEKIADDKGIKIDSIGPPRNPAKPNDFYKETQVEVKIKGVLLNVLVDFLYRIENSQEFLKITSIRVRPNYSKPMYLDVTFSVSTFSPI